MKFKPEKRELLGKGDFKEVYSTSDHKLVMAEYISAEQTKNKSLLPIDFYLGKLLHVLIPGMPSITHAQRTFNSNQNKNDSNSKKRPYIIKERIPTDSLHNKISEIQDKMVEMASSAYSDSSTNQKLQILTQQYLDKKSHQLTIPGIQELLDKLKLLGLTPELRSNNLTIRTDTNQAVYLDTFDLIKEDFEPSQLLTGILGSSFKPALKRSCLIWYCRLLFHYVETVRRTIINDVKINQQIPSTKILLHSPPEKLAMILNRIINSLPYNSFKIRDQITILYNKIKTASRLYQITKKHHLKVPKK